MIEWVRRHPFWTGVLILGGFLGFHAYNVLQLYLDITAVNSVTSGPPPLPPAAIASWPVSQRYDIDLVSGMEPPNRMEGAPSLEELVSSGEGEKFFGSEEDLDKYLTQVPERGKIQDELARRLSQVVASWPAPGPEREFSHPWRPSPNYRKARDAARFWCVLAWDLARQSDPRRALLAICGPAILGTYLEIRETQVECVDLMGLLIGSALRRMTGLGLAELAPSVNLSKPLVQEMLSWLEAVEKHAIPFQRALLTEKKFLSNCAYYLSREIEKGYAEKIYGRKPRALARLLNNRHLIDFYIEPTLGRAIKIVDKPYPEGRSQLQEVDRRNEEVFLRLQEPGWHWLWYFFRPERFVLEFYCGLIPKAYKGYVQWLKGKAVLRGGGAAVLLHAFRQEKNGWPDSVAQVENWLGGKRWPVDPFTNAPFAYEGGTAPRLFSPGPDLATGTSDDLTFLLLPASETSSTGRR